MKRGPRIPGFFVCWLVLICVGCSKPQVENLPERKEMTLVKGESSPLGNFELTGKRLYAADPGYEKETIKIKGLGVILDNCRTGVWKSYLILKHFKEMKYPMDSELIAHHESITNTASIRWTLLKDETVGVDSGQAGIFDAKHFADDSLVPKDMKWTFNTNQPAVPYQLWYSMCCELTVREPGAGIIPFGVVSSSGYGDGGYDCYVYKDAQNEIVGVRIVFVDDKGRG